MNFALSAFQKRKAYSLLRHSYSLYKEIIRQFKKHLKLGIIFLVKNQ